MTHTNPGAAPDVMYEPSACNVALAKREADPWLAGYDNGGMDYPTLDRLKRTWPTPDRPQHYHSERASSMWPLSHISNPVARRLRELRLTANVSAKMAAKGIGCSDTLLLQYERGDRDILNAPYDRVVAVARFYGVPVDDITNAACSDLAAD